MISVIFILTVLSISPQADTISVEEDLSINHQQKIILDKFREIVLPYLPHKYMQEDIYLIRWLRARDFNLKEAEEMLQENLKWRKENNIENIPNEDFTEIKRQFKYWIDGEDKEGRPIFFMDVGEWDLRRAMLTGLGPRLLRAVNGIYDEINSNIRKMQADGKNVTQYYEVVDLNGYNIVQHGCVQCIALVLNTISSYENHFPGTCHKIVLVNTPEIFKPVLDIFRAVLSPLTKDRVFVYGRNNKEGQKALLNDINSDQLPIEVGGTRELPF